MAQESMKGYEALNSVTKSALAISTYPRRAVSSFSKDTLASCSFSRWWVSSFSFLFNSVTSLYRVRRASLYWSYSLIKVLLRFLRWLITPFSATYLSWSTFMHT